VHTKDELDKLLQNEAFARAERIQFVEIMMEQLDAPRALKVQSEMSGKTNAYKGKATA
jgi:pyruvate decarboxylase